MMDERVGEPIFIEEVGNQPGFICFKIKEEKDDDGKYNIIKVHEDELFFEDYDWIEHIISQERSYPMDIDTRRIKRKNEEFLKNNKEKHGKNEK